MPWRDHQPALKDKRPGVTYCFAMLAPGEGNPLVASGETRSLGLQQFAAVYDLKRAFSLTFDGYLNVPADGIYEFQIESSRDAQLFIDGATVLNMLRMKDASTAQNFVPLRAGLHKIGIRYANDGSAPPVFRVRWAIKGQNWRNLGGGELVH